MTGVRAEIRELKLLLRQERRPNKQKKNKNKKKALSVFLFQSSSPFSFLRSDSLLQTLSLARSQTMELFIPSMASMSAALGSNSQRDQLTALGVAGMFTTAYEAIIILEFCPNETSRLIKTLFQLQTFCKCIL